MTRLTVPFDLGEPLVASYLTCPDCGLRRAPSVPECPRCCVRPALLGDDGEPLPQLETVRPDVGSHGPPPPRRA